MKKLLKKIKEINSKYCGIIWDRELEKAIQAYTISPCDCKEDETTGTIIEEVCNNCGRGQK